MSDLITEFIEYMSSCGLSPATSSEIIADNKRRNFQIEGDRKNSKKGYYKLNIDGDFGYGFFGDYRQSECHSWHNTTNKDITPEQLKALKERAENNRLAEKERQEKEHKMLAQEAVDETMFLEDCPEGHPYLTRKKIKPCGALIGDKDWIYLPAKIGNQVWSWQKISGDGRKIFKPNARISGCYYTIEGAGDTSYVCEGFSTGASIHEATGATVHCCFYAGNLISAIENIKKHDSNELVLCADNDHETVIQNKPYNTGITKGTEAAKHHDIKMCFPNFTKEDEGLSDFNDYLAKYGKDSVKRIITGAVATADKGGALKPHDETHSIEDSAPSPFEFLHTTKKGAIIKNSINVLILLKYDEGLRGLFCFNSFEKRIILTKCPPWEDDADFSIRQIQDYDYFSLVCYIEQDYGTSFTKNIIIDAIEKVAFLPENKFNPAQEYFKSLAWDGESRLATWLKEYVSDGSQNNEYLEMVGVKFMCGLAARAMQPGIKFDTMLILEGDQNAGKSTLAAIMATIHGEEYFLDDFKAIDNKDALMKMQGQLVVEFPEISTMKKAEVDDLKAFLSRRTDVFRAPYGRNTIEAPRQCVFVGTVNPEGGYLRDVTGNRRYLSVKCRHKLDLAKLKEVMPELHAEAAYLVRANKVRLWLDDDEIAMLTKEHKTRMVEDIWTDQVESFVQNLDSVSSKDICEHLGLTTEKRNAMSYSRIKKIMVSIGWEYGRINRGSKQARGFFKPNTQTQKLNFEEEQDIAW